MNTEEVKKLTAKERFLYWISERDSILTKRNDGYEKPWTDDEILQSCYFTNVRREDDKVTIWFRENVREPIGNDPDVIFATIAFRWFNLPQPTGEYLHTHGYLTNWNKDRVIQGLLGFQNHGLKIFTGAFNISNSGSTKPKINRVCEDYLEPVWQARKKLISSISNKSMKEAFNYLKQLPGLGGSGFMAAQVICDLAFTYALVEAEDWYTWCSWGPGSKRGMNRVYGLEESYPMSRLDWDIRLKRLREEIKDKFYIKLHARDVQNCLCEFSKYERVLWNQGKSKRRYQGV